MHATRMIMPRNFWISTIICIMLGTLLTACSGNNHDSGGTGAVTVSGIVSDDPIAGAQVTLLGVHAAAGSGAEPTLATAVTDANGRYDLSTTAPPPYRLTVSGGTMNGQPFPGTLTAYCETADSCNASPYTSALDHMMQANGKNYLEATHELARVLNVSYDPFLHEIETGQTVPSALFNLAAAKSALTSETAISTWITNLAATAMRSPGATTPPGVRLPLRAATSELFMLKGPYLMLTGNNTEMSVHWQVSPDMAPAVTGASLAFGTHSTAKQSVTLDAPLTDTTGVLYRYTITGLTPGTLYDYTVTLNGSVPGLPKQYNGTFVAPPLATAQKTSFYAYGDTRSNPKTHSNIVGGIITDMTDTSVNGQSFVVHVGDFVNYGYDESAWNTEFFSKDVEYANTQQFLASMPIMTSVGNHEFRSATDNRCGDTNNADIFRKYWPSDLYQTYDEAVTGQRLHNYYYSFDYGPIHFIVLDPYTAYYMKDSRQYRWLESDLKTTQKKWKVVVTHVPLYDASGSNANAGCYLLDMGSRLQKEIQPLLETYGVQLVLQGHQHYYARSTINNITYIVTGGGGAPISPLKKTGLPALSSPPAKAAGIYEFTRVNVDETEMKVSVFEVKNAAPNGSAPVNSLFEEITIRLDGTATIK